MNVPQGLPILFEVAAGYRHKHHSRTVNKANKYLALTTGEGMDELLKQFARRESPELFKQRVDITQHITSSVVSNIMAIFNKLPRANYSQDLYHVGETDTKKTDTLKGIIGKFWGNTSLDDWFATRYMELNAVDPNAWCVLEFEATDGREYAQTYPFEVSSAQAADFGIVNNVVEYLIVDTPMSVLDGDTQTPRNKYTMYLKNETVVIIPLPTKGTPKGKDRQPATIMGKDENGEPIEVAVIVWIDKLPYSLHFHFPHNAGQVPAFRIGYKRDLWTGGQTFVSCFSAAEPMLEKSLKINSEADLAKSLAAFPLTLRYADPCKANDCDSGFTRAGDKCHVCHGTGHHRPTSVAEELVFEMPRAARAEDIIDLEKLWVWKMPPVELLKYQDEVVDNLTRRAVEIVFNSDVHTRQEVQDTATGKRLSLENTYDTLYTNGLDYAQKWEFCVYTIAAITELDKGLVAAMRFPKDFQLKDTTELLAELAAATTSGAGPQVRQSIEERIVSAMLVDDPEEMRRYNTKALFNPFRGMTDGEIAIALNTDYTPRRLKVQYLNLGYIFDEVEAEQNDLKKDFFAMTYKFQKALIDAKVQALIAEATPEAPELGTGDVGAGTPEEKELNVSLALQQLALARERATKSGDTTLAASLGIKMNELLARL